MKTIRTPRYGHVDFVDSVKKISDDTKWMKNGGYGNKKSPHNRH